MILIRLSIILILSDVCLGFSDSDELTTYPAVCLGGTFDHMHVGHHILLSQACLLATQSVTVGVTDGPMNTSQSHSFISLSITYNFCTFLVVMKDTNNMIIYLAPKKPYTGGTAGGSTKNE